MEREGRNSPEERRRNLPRILGAAVAVLAFVLAFVVLAPSTPPAPDESVNSADSVTEPTSSQPDQGRSSGGLVEAPGQDSTAPAIDEAAEYVPGQVVVQFGPGASAESVNEALASLPCVSEPAVTQADVEAGYALLSLAEGYSVSDAIAEMRRVEDVVSPQPNYVYYLAEDELSGVSSSSGLSAAAVDREALGAQDDDYWDVNDPDAKRTANAARKWHLEAIHVYEAWKTVRGDAGGTRVTVAVVDSGCDLTHPDLKDNIVASYDATKNPQENYNSGMADGQGHGTHVAGIIASTANNGVGSAGVSYNAKILPIQVFHNEGGSKYAATSVSLKAAYDYIIANREKYNIRVVNLSVGAKQSAASDSDRLALGAIEDAYEANVLTVCAATNGSNVTEAYTAYPVSFMAHGIGVIALKRDGDKLVRADYSNFNTGVTTYMDISAPGSAVYSTVNGGSYGSKSGTSMAAPVVSGVVALLFTANPSLSPDDAMDIIHSTATDLTPSNSSADTSVGFDAQTGYGVVNAKAAVESANIYLSGDSSVLKGGSTRLVLTGLSPNVSVTWSSADPAIATVSQDGTVTGVSGGTVAITADVGSRKVVKTITVYDIYFSVASYANGKLVDSPRLDECELRAGESVTLRFNENPDTGLWLIGSSDTNVVTARVPGDGTVAVSAVGSGEAYVTATLKENSDLVVRFKVSVIGSENKANLVSSQASITWPFLNSAGKQSTTYYYTGSAITPVPSKVIYSTKVGDQLVPGDPLKLNTDYTVSYSGNVNAGTAKATVTGKGSYTGSVSQSFAITRTPLTHAKITATVPSVTYTGSALKPVPTLELSISGTYTLRQGVDFQVVSYKNNVNPGTGSVTIAGIGNFSGTRTIPFTISQTDAQKGHRVTYRTHVQNVGWQGYVTGPSVSGTSGRSLRLEGINISLADHPYAGSIQYRTHIQNIGWESGWRSDGAMSGTSGRSLRLEAIQVRLTGAMAAHYDVYYRVHCQNIGWMGWAKNGASAGTAGFAYRLEAIQVQLVPKGSAAPGSTSGAFRDAAGNLSGVPDSESGVLYRTHVQNVGWQNYMRDGEQAGTSGRSLRLEGINIKLGGTAGSGGITYRTHVQNIGWQGWCSNGAMSGTSGRSLRLEAIEVKLTGAAATRYDVYYRVHCQNIGWMGWAKNGQAAGTAGYAYRLEAIQVKLVPKGSAAPGTTADHFRSR